MTYEEVFTNKDYTNISFKAARKYTKFLTPEELEQCRCLGIWRAVERFNGKSSLGTFIYNNVVWECNKTLTRNSRLSKQVYIDKPLEYNTSMLFNDLQASLKPDEYKLLVDIFVEKKTYKEVSTENSISISRVRKNLSGLLRRLKDILG